MFFKNSLVPAHLRTGSLINCSWINSFVFDFKVKRTDLCVERGLLHLSKLSILNYLQWRTINYWATWRRRLLQHRGIDSFAYPKKLMDRGLCPQAWNYLDRLKISGNNFRRPDDLSSTSARSPAQPHHPEEPTVASRTSGLIRSSFKVLSVFFWDRN